MMREIIFKGKRVDNGEWIEGAYMPYYYSTRYGKVAAIFIKYGKLAAIFTNDDDLCKTYRYPVDPSTVGQYTGLKDKNGNRIFEGDIVRWCGSMTGYVSYGTGCFVVKVELPKWANHNRPALDIVMYESKNEVEIIGNIHDNPELLKGAQE